MPVKPPIRPDIHAEAMRMPFHELMRTLNTQVGATVVQTMAGTTDPAAPGRWARPDTPEPQLEVVSRLRLGCRVWRTVAITEGPDTALAWLMGANATLEGELPVLYIQQQRARDVLGAAEAFVNDTHSA